MSQWGLRGPGGAAVLGSAHMDEMCLKRCGGGPERPHQYAMGYGLGDAHGRESSRTRGVPRRPLVPMRAAMCSVIVGAVLGLGGRVPIAHAEAAPAEAAPARQTPALPVSAPSPASTSQRGTISDAQTPPSTSAEVVPAPEDFASPQRIDGTRGIAGTRGIGGPACGGAHRAARDGLAAPRRTPAGEDAGQPGRRP